MVDDNNMCDLIAAGALVALFTVCASDMRKLTAKVTYWILLVICDIMCKFDREHVGYVPLALLLCGMLR